MREIKIGTAYNLMVFMTDATTHILGDAGLTLVITASKNGAAFASISPTVTDRGDGWYNIALTSSHTDTFGDLALHITATGADPTDVIMQVVYHKPYGIRKNTALTNFTFLMIDSTNHYAPVTGRTITATRSIDGGAFGACSNSATEVANGIYKIDFTTTDLNGDNIVFKFAATGADDRLITVITEP
jgi:hypothetical protein